MPEQTSPSRFPVIIGPTAGGKSDLAVDVALLLAGRGLRAEVVTADSVQIYRGMNIGSAKPTVEEQRGIPHQLIDIVEPTERFTVADWLVAAEHAIAGIKSGGGVPIVVGGTHLYIKALLEGLFEGPEPDAALRDELRSMGLARLRTELDRIDPVAAARIHPNDERRTIRAIEVYRQTGKPISTMQSQWDRGGRSDCVVVGLEWPTELLNRRINARVKTMMEKGLLDEVRALQSAGRLGSQAREALGYKQLIRYLDADSGEEGAAAERRAPSLEEAIEQIKKETRRFAKNQRTWLRRLRTTPGSIWIDCASGDRAVWAARIVEACGLEP